MHDEPLPAPPMAPILQVAGLTKHYAGTRAVGDLSFEVRGGEVLGLVGRNGAGKTTTLRTIAGVLPIESGRISIAGNDLATRRGERAAKAKLAWVPDDPEPFEAMTVDEHLEFTAALYRAADWRGRADELLERFELTPKREALGGELSRGMRQKLAFCCALLPRPQLVLLDEPLSGLDPLGIRSAKRAIAEIAAEGRAVVLSSHLLDLVEELSSRLLILEQGRAAFLGTLAEARQAARGDALEDVFFSIAEGRVPGEAPAPEVEPGNGVVAEAPPESEDA